jgi:hypothetical protein
VREGVDEDAYCTAKCLPPTCTARNDTFGQRESSPSCGSKVTVSWAGINLGSNSSLHLKRAQLGKAHTRHGCLLRSLELGNHEQVGRIWRLGNGCLVSKLPQRTGYIANGHWATCQCTKCWRRSRTAKRKYYSTNAGSSSQETQFG